MTLAKIIFIILLVIICLFNNIKESKSIRPPSNSQNATTIKTIYGEIYNCVDFYEQPAFKHPRLKNHKFHPEMIPKIGPTIRHNSLEESELYVLENGGCPSGMVPIKRLSKEDHLRASVFPKNNVVNRNYSTNDMPLGPPGTHYAILQKNSGGNQPHYYGVGAYFSVWKPTVKENQYSAGQITIQNGAESLQVGWMINPTMYKDDRPHVFIHTNAGGSHCYNSYCSGYITVRSDLPPDVVIKGYTESGQRPKMVGFFIYRESKFGTWWLLATKDKIPIGYWPGDLFTSLKDYGTYISCGGETYSPPDQPGGLPPMGSGAFPVGILQEDALASNFETADDQLKETDVVDTEKYMDTKKYYVEDAGIRGSNGHVLFFGGYGG